jgi:hypothetical protein
MASRVNRTISGLRNSGLVLLLGFILGQLLPSWLPFILDWRQPTFNAQLRQWFPFAPGELAMMRYTGRWEGQQIDMMAFLRITNLRAEPIRVDGYRLEGGYADGWKGLGHLALSDPVSVEFNPGMGKPQRPLNFRDSSFDLTARSTLIPAGGSIEGWAFFQWPSLSMPVPEARNVPTPPRTFRLQIFDTRVDTTLIEPLPSPPPRSLHGEGFWTMPDDWIPPWRQKPPQAGQ